MSLFGIVVPKAGENLIENPSAGINNDFWEPWGTGSPSAVRSSEAARFGSCSIKVDSDSGSGGARFHYTTQIPIVGGDDYYISLWYRSTTPVSVEVREQDDNILATMNGQATGTGWALLEADVGPAGSDDHIYLDISLGGASRIAYIDGILFEHVIYRTTYIDGDQPSCYWLGIPHASLSKRVDFGAGGRIWDFDDLGIYVENMSGYGMPALTHHLQGLGILPGDLLEGTKVQSRVMTLVFWANGTSLGNLHALRQGLIDAVKPDRGNRGRSFKLIYKGGGKTTPDRYIETNLIYEAGLEGRNLKGFYESFAVRFLGLDPFFYSQDQETAEIDFTKTETVRYLIQRYEGEWGWIDGTGAQAQIRAMVQAPDGTIYVAGDFTSLGGVSDTAYFARIVNGAVEACSTIQLNGAVYALAVDSAGDVYVAGSFTTYGATTCNRICKYDASAETFSTMGSTPGVDGTVLALAIDSKNYLYLAGEFTDEGNYAAQWTGSAFATVPTGGSDGGNAKVRTVTISRGDRAFFGGDFTTFAGDNHAYVAQYDRGDDAVTGVGQSAFSAYVSWLGFGPDGTLYACGNFIIAGGNTVNYIARWRGGSWEQLAGGFNAPPESFDFLKNGDLFVVGGMDSASGGAWSLDRFAIWTGDAWIRPSIGDFGSGNGTRVLAPRFGSVDDVIIAVDDTGETPVVGEKTTVTNTGTAEARPFVVFEGPGTLVWLENRSSGDRCFFEVGAEAGEKITIDFRIGSRGIRSDWRPEIPLAPREASDFGSFTLLPGENDVHALIVDSTGATKLIMAWTPAHWSADGVHV